MVFSSSQSPGDSIPSLDAAFGNPTLWELVSDLETILSDGKGVGL